jgi:3-keto-disaccharide hydrolase
MRAKTPVYLLGSVLFSALLGCSSAEVIDASECTNALSEEEAATGWRLLFDGSSLDAWRSYQEEELNSGWGVENGCLARLGRGGDIISREQFGNFELKLEWRISDSGNSGIFIRGDESERSIHHTGYEMQVLDNVGHSDSEDPSHRAGAFYDMIAPDHDTTQPVGFWNKVHIIADGAQVEFRLNGRTTAKFEQGSAEWERLYQQSKFTDRPRYGSLLKGHIGFQDHWDKVWFRNIRVLDIGSGE